MKTRTDFVSNSSSSSFILKDVGFFSFFGITKQDIIDAIVELHGGKELYDKQLKDAIVKLEDELANADASNESKKWHIDYCKERLEELKTKGLNFWCVYDMTNEKDCEECFREWDKHFAEWYAPNEGEASTWHEIIDALQFKCGFSNIDDVVNGRADELETSTYDYEPGKNAYVQFPGGAAFIKYVKDKLSAKTMKEVLHDKDCTMMIHFADNEVHALKGMSDYGKGDLHDWNTPEMIEQCKNSCWDSRSCTSDRFFEVLIKYFIGKGKIDLSDSKFLEFWCVDDKDGWYKKTYPNKKYYLDNDTATWKDVVDDCLRCNAVMHEG